jgi:outer membrane biosynthesis protein TonB
MKSIGNANYDSVEYKNYALAKKKALQTSTSSAYARPAAVENRAGQVATVASAIPVVKAQPQPQLSQPQQPQPQPQSQPQPQTTIKPKQQQQQQKPQRPQRPSFSDQLAAIGAQADSVTQGMRKDRDYLQPQAAGGGQGGVIATMPARCFTIGALSCR